MGFIITIGALFLLLLIPAIVLFLAALSLGIVTTTADKISTLAKKREVTK